MHLSVLLALWGCVAYIVFTLINHVREEIRHRRNAKRLGCEAPYPLQRKWDFLGIHTAVTAMKHLKANDFVPFAKEVIDKAWEKEGRIISTMSQVRY